MSNLTAESLFKTLAAVALADGVLAPEELVVLEGLGARLRVAPSETARWLEEVKAEGAAPRSLALPENADDAVELLEGMVKVAAADGVILASERVLLDRVRGQLGLDAKRLESLVAYHLSAATAKLAAAEPLARRRGAESALDRFQLLATVAFADGVLAPEELAALDRYRARLGLEPSEAARVLDGVKADRRGPENVDLSNAEAGGAELLEDMVKIAAADGVLHPAERRLLERMRRGLGVDEKRLVSLLAYALPEANAGSTVAPSTGRSVPEGRGPSRAVLVLGLLLLLLAALGVVLVWLPARS
jgi:uncharacterized tellurite resistance protein B-like protein